MEELLMITNEEYAVLEDMYIELDGVYVKLDDEHTQLNIEHTNLIGEYNTLDDIHTELEDSIPGIIEESFATGHNEGNITGYEQGTIVGEIAGYTSGYDIGLEDGYSWGNEVGIGIGYETGFDVGYEEGYEGGVRRDYTGWGWFVRDPTYNELLSFIRKDRTDEMGYVVDGFTCHDFADMLRNNAYKQGYRSFGVYLYLVDSAHAIIGFNTTDRGMVFIEPQNDYFVELEIGVSYWKTALQSPQKYRPTYSDIIVRWSIYW